MKFVWDDEVRMRTSTVIKHAERSFGCPILEATLAGCAGAGSGGTGK